MLTLKHFFDRPTWAAAAGYDFNFIDCLSFSAGQYDRIWGALADVCFEFPDTSVRELPLMLVVTIAAITGVIVWPFIFWALAVPLWFKCRRVQKKYQHEGGMSEIASANIKRWKRECERGWKIKS